MVDISGGGDFTYRMHHGGFYYLAWINYRWVVVKMTANRVKAIRFFFKDTPYEFSIRSGIYIGDLSMIEKNLQEPTQDEIDIFKDLERRLALKGVTTEKLDTREGMYATI